MEGDTSLSDQNAPTEQPIPLEPIESPQASEPPKRSGLFTLLSKILSHPGRSLAIGSLLILILGGVGFFGLNLWGRHHLQKARDAQAKYHSQEAYDHLKTYTSIWSEDREALLMLARASRRLGSFDEAESYLRRREDLHGSDDELTMEWLMLRASRGEVDAVAQLCFQLVEQKRPESSLLLEALTRGYIRVLQFPEAEFTLNEWLKKEPTNPQAHWYQGLIHLDRAYLQPASTSFRAVLKADPDRHEARQHLAEILLDLAQAEEARPHLEYLRKQQPDELEVQVLLARCLGQLNKQDEAKRILDEVLSKSPALPTALAHRGRIALQTDELDVAERCLKKSCEVSPGNQQTHYQYLQCLNRLGKTAEAKRILAKLTQIEKDQKRINALLTVEMQPGKKHDASFYSEVGELTMRAGERQAGLGWFARALREDPKHGPTHRALAAYYKEEGDEAKAAYHRSKAEAAESRGGS